MMAHSIMKHYELMDVSLIFNGTTLLDRFGTEAHHNSQCSTEITWVLDRQSRSTVGTNSGGSGWGIERLGSQS